MGVVGNGIGLNDDGSSDRQSLMFKRVGSAVFYGAASFMITVVNKTVLTTYK